MIRYIDDSKTFVEISLTKDKPAISSNYWADGDIGKEFADFINPYLETASPNKEKRYDLKFELIELHNINDVSNFVLSLKRKRVTKQMPFYKYRIDLILQNSVYLLDVKNNGEFQFDLDDQSFTISGQSNDAEENWVFKIFGEFVKIEK